VDGLELELLGKASVVRLNLGENIGVTMARAFGVHSTPTFIITDGNGQETWRKSGFPDKAAILRAINGVE
jgi:thioredoxin-related protein